VHIGVTLETVSRWEHGKVDMPPTAERLLRILAYTRQPVSHYPLEFVRTMATEAPRPLKVGLQVDEAGWHPTRRRELAHA
jgi:transcriptional regulator with XRE-family HTH domain